MKIYLCGPMTGLPLYNFPAFNETAARLRKLGHEVFNPAEIDNGDTSRSWDYYMRKDLVAVMASEAIVTLPGWENSKGARLEVHVAESLNIPVLREDDVPKPFKFPRIALTGFARTGKDEVGKILINHGYVRVAFGDIIKRQLDPLIRQHFGFSAFTEKNEEKARIRGTLEHWGEDNYDAIFREFFETLPPVAANTRLVRAREAAEWVDRGGVIFRVERPGRGPETEFAARMAREMDESNLITGIISNDRTLDDLERAVTTALA